jgi:hypothetical protein
VAAPDLLPGGKGGPGRPGRYSRSSPLGVRLPHVGAQDHPAVVQARSSRSRELCPRGHVETRDLLERGGRSGDRDPSCQGRAVRPVTQRLSAWLRITSRPRAGYTSRRYLCLYVPTNTPCPVVGRLSWDFKKLP